MKNTRRVTVLAFALAPLVWIVDAVLDWLFFYETDLWSVLVADVPLHEFYVRSAGVAIVLAFACIVAVLVRRLEGTKEQLESSAARYRDFFRTSADPVFITTREGRWVDMNEAAVEMFGYDSREELEQVPVPDIYADPEDRQEFTQQIIEQGFVKQRPTRLRRKDGSLIDTLITAALRTDVEARVLGFQGTIRDVTEQKEAERRIRELSRFPSENPNPVLHADPEGAILYANQGSEELLTHWETREGRPLPPACRETIARVIEEGTVESAEIQCRDTTYALTFAPVGQSYVNIYGMDITQQKKAEVAVQASRRRLERTIAAAPFPIMVHAEDGEVVSINEVWTDITGYTPDEIPTIKDWTDRAYGERGDEVESDIDSLYDMDGRVDEGEYEVICNDGPRRVWAFSSAPLGRAPDGRRLVVSMAMDVTERKAAEQRVQNLNSLLRAIRNVNQLIVQEDTPQAILQKSCETLLETRQYEHVWAVTFDGEGRLRYTGEAGVEAPFDALLSRMETGWRPSCLRRALAAPTATIAFEPHRECEECPMTAGYTGSRVLKCGFVPATDVRGVLSIALSEDHESTAEEEELIAEIAGDIGHGLQRMQVEQRLRLRDRAVENATNGIALTDLDGAVVSANPAVLQMWHFEDESDILGLGASEFWKSPEAARKAFEEVKHQGVWEGEMTAVRKDGSEFIAQAFLSLVTDAEENPTHVLGVFDDITQRKQLERQREEAYEELQQAQRQLVDQERQRALTTMASGIAHDFNNALSTILGFTDLLLQNPEDLEDKETAREYLARIAKAASNAAETVRRMRKFYRPAEQVEFRLLDLNSIVHEAVSMTRPLWRQEAQAEGKHIDVETELGTIPAVRGNEGELHEVVTNLIFNAVDAIEEQGRITLTTQPAEGNVVLEVRDTGRGMDEDTRRRCLTPFFTTKGGTGTGLGLSVTDGIVRSHDGTIEIASKPGEGTTFRITLPAATTETAGQTEPSAGIEEVESLRVLVVEDDGTERMMLVKMMEVLGHTAVAAADGVEALEKLDHGYYHLIITDSAMPKMDGHELARRVKQRSPEQPIIMLTGFGDMMDAAGERPECVDLVLSKPAALEDLRQAIARLMPKRAQD